MGAVANSAVTCNGWEAEVGGVRVGGDPKSQCPQSGVIIRLVALEPCTGYTKLVCPTVGATSHMGGNSFATRYLGRQ